MVQETKDVWQWAFLCSMSLNGVETLDAPEPAAGQLRFATVPSWVAVYITINKSVFFLQAEK